MSSPTNIMAGRMPHNLLVLATIASAIAYGACGGGDSDDMATPEGPVGVPLTVVGIDERFEPEQLDAPAGAITLTFDNQDADILHNIRFYEGADADGRFVRKTDLERGPEVQTLELNLEPGTYFYDCEVHPASMTGTLLVR